MAVYPTIGVEMDFGAGFVDITSDVLFDKGFTFRYGMSSGAPDSRVADTGWFSFSLDNDIHNSGGTLGYYSPLHASCRSGFTFGIAVRVKFVYAATTYYKWRGVLSEIGPAPGLKRSRVTRCLAVDWFNEPGNYDVREVALQINKRSDEVFSAILAVIPKQPAATSIGTGKDTYTYALDNIGNDSHPPASALFHDIMMSELGYLFVKGDSTQGGTLDFENRHVRPLTTTAAITFNNDMVDIKVPRTLDRIWNRVEVTTHPRRVDSAATTVLFSLLSQPIVQSGETVTIWGDFNDPTQQLSRVGGTAMVAPVATTDYTMNTASDGSGANMTASFSVTATFFAASVKFDVTNNSMTDSGYVTKLQCRGKGLYDYAPETSISDDTAAQLTQGLRVLPINMPYQDSRVNGQGAADWIRNLYSSPAKQVDSIQFFANHSATFLTAALAQEISARISISETVTGVASSGNGWFVNAIEFDVEPTLNGPAIWCTWILTPASNSQAWILETVGFSELDSTTILGYF